jgi:hypothetical protein
MEDSVHVSCYESTQNNFTFLLCSIIFGLKFVYGLGKFAVVYDLN